MEYRRLGSSGLQLSVLSLGTWVTFGRQVDRKLARELVAFAFDHGVNYFDSSETYAAGMAETLLGQALADLKLPHDAFCVSSKVYFGCVTDPKPTQKGLSRKHVTEACDQALERLQVDHLDCFFCHRADPDTPVAETVWAMDTLIRQGKVLYWGTSEWPVEAIIEAHAVAERYGLHAPTMEQPQYNLLHRQNVEQAYAPLCQRYGMGMTIWSPLASGVLTGKYARGVPEGSRLTLPGYQWLRERYDFSTGSADMKHVAGLAAIAGELGITPAQLAIAWCVKNPQVSTVMLGATRQQQLEENLQALAAVGKLTPEVMQRIAAAVAWRAGSPAGVVPASGKGA